MLWSCEACVEELQNCTEWIWWMLVTLFVFFDKKIEQGELPGRLLHLLRPAAGEGSLWQSSEVAPSGQRRWWDAWYGAKIYAAIQHHSTSFNIIQAFLYHFTDVSMFREELSMWLSWTLKTLLDFESEISRFEDAKMDQCDQRGCASFCEDMWHVGQVTVGSPTGLLSYCSLIPRFLTDSSPIPHQFLSDSCVVASFLHWTGAGAASSRPILPATVRGRRNHRRATAADGGNRCAAMWSLCLCIQESEKRGKPMGALFRYPKCSSAQGKREVWENASWKSCRKKQPSPSGKKQLHPHSGSVIVWRLHVMSLFDLERNDAVGFAAAAPKAGFVCYDKHMLYPCHTNVLSL